MDNQRFDSLTRAMAIGKSRRDVLKILAGGVAGGALAVTAFDDVYAACHGLPCPCCAGTECVDGVCVESMAAPAPAPAAPAAESSGTTTVTTAPSTGVGPNGADSGVWLGAAMAGGAALLASKILRRDKQGAEDTA